MGGSGAANSNTPAGVFDSLRQRFQALNTNQRLFMGLGFAGLVLALGVVFSAGKSSQDYRVLFANVNEGDGAAIITALQQMNVPYQFTEGGGAITVPQALVYETRLKLAGQGLPKAGNVGFELLENQKFGTSQFVGASIICGGLKASWPAVSVRWDKSNRHVFIWQCPSPLHLCVSKNALQLPSLSPCTLAAFWMALKLQPLPGWSALLCQACGLKRCPSWTLKAALSALVPCAKTG